MAKEGCEAMEQASRVANIFVAWAARQRAANAAAPPEGSNSAQDQVPGEIPEDATSDADADGIPDTSTYAIQDATSLQLEVYLASVQRNTGFKRLHKLGNCPLRPNIDDAQWVGLGFDEPPASGYNARCKHCPKAAADMGAGMASVLSSSWLSPSSSDYEGSS